MSGGASRRRPGDFEIHFAQAIRQADVAQCQSVGPAAQRSVAGAPGRWPGRPPGRRRATRPSAAHRGGATCGQIGGRGSAVSSTACTSEPEGTWPRSEVGHRRGMSAPTAGAVTGRGGDIVVEPTTVLGSLLTPAVSVGPTARSKPEYEVRRQAVSTLRMKAHWVQRPRFVGSCNGDGRPICDGSITGPPGFPPPEHRGGVVGDPGRN